MATRLELQAKLVELLGSENVYYQPPESLRMNYPAIKYSLNDVDQRHADDMTYFRQKEYQLIVIDRVPDNPVIDELLALPYCSFDRTYKSDNLHHTVLSLYF